ncbi:phosphate acetyl/butaryl transferase [Legionella geestiana]|uniref:Phosphate acetyltransferase n=1 Tax=Legionella geestiana TaxID=45065 RepID=A0A0W0U8W5_9GAMM|nr:phosphate acetyltransferase [Legionella geestiana]KTD04234.1 phosphate acetyl/butaryl transferase [Legionella geestiana]QBS11654.1 phosphate acetyltransferase [Legionella geestiana]QDQ40735.1 phosphate acetyltransferase [Legionella geestiana]STX53661.1 phosphate acetyl/butaryl transferase [Legionella geestiana]
MHKPIYLTGIEKRPGKSFVSLGMASLLKSAEPDLRVCKLFSESDSAQPALLEALSGSKVPAIMPIADAIELMAHNPEDLIAAVLDASRAAASAPLTYLEGSDFESDNAVFEYQFNLTLAAQLNCAVILVVCAKDRTLAHTLSLLNTSLEIARQQHADIAGVVINRVEAGSENDALDFFQQALPHIPFVTIIPEIEKLARPSVRDIAKILDADVICGADALERLVSQFTIAAKTVGDFLESRLDRAGMLIITPGDRVDILLGSLLADQSANYPKIAGIVLTGGDRPGRVLQEIIAGLEHPFPVLVTAHRTWETATTLYSAKFSLQADDLPKAEMAIELMRPWLSPVLTRLMQKDTGKAVTSPAVFLYHLLSRAKTAARHIVLPEGDDPRILQAADYLQKRRIVRLTLLGNPEKIQLAARRLSLDLTGIAIIDVAHASARSTYAETYFKLRQHKNVNLPIATERMNDANYFGAMMVYCGDADGMVSGAVHTTADTVRPALEIIRTRKGVQKVSSVFIMCLPTRVLIYGDCAINPEPDSAELAEIALQSADIAQKLGIDPRVALLSYSSGTSGKGESVEKVVNAVQIVHEKAPDLLAEGPIQYDAAVDPEVGAKKLPGSKIAGFANVLIFPDLNTGNNTYKAVQRESGALAIGPVLLGLNKPVNDLSRGCTPQDIINTILVTAIQAAGDNSCAS